MLKFSANTKDFAHALELAIGAVETKIVVPILGSVLIAGNNDGLRIEATDLETSMITKCEADVSHAGEVALPAKRLLAYVKQLTGETITFSSTEKHWATLTCGKSTAKIPGQDRAQWPEIPAMPSESVVIPLPDLQRMIRICQAVIPTGERKFGVQAARLEAADGILRGVACDGAALGLAEIASDIKVDPVLISPAGLTQLMRLNCPLVAYAVEENNTFFSTPDCTLVSRRIEENFPKYEKILKGDTSTTLTVGRADLKSALQRVAGFTDSEATPVDFIIDSTGLKLAGSTAVNGEAKEGLDAQVDGPPVQFRANCVYFMRFIAAFTSDLVRIRMSSPKDPIFIEALSDKREMAVVQPLWK